MGNRCVFFLVHVFFIKLKFRVRGWCLSLDSKNTYKDNYIYIPPKVPAGLEPVF
jgi:hypothetical protein